MGELYLTNARLCHHRNESAIETGSGESHFNASLIVKGIVTNTVSTNHNFGRERRAEAELNLGHSARRFAVRPSGRLGSPNDCIACFTLHDGLECESRAGFCAPPKSKQIKG